MRETGIIKITLALTADLLLAYFALGLGAAILLDLGIMLYAWIGEYTALAKDRAVRLDRVNGYDRPRLQRICECLAEDVRRVSGTDISGVRLHVIPSDHINAFAYGFRNIAVTRGALNSCDDTTLCAILGHEISHILNMDAVVNRIVFANVTLVMAGLIAGSFVSAAVLWVLFIALCAFGICGGLAGALVFHGVTKLVKGTYTAIQHMVLFIYRTVMGLVSRSCEFRADQYSCQLGYGPQLGYFLTRFAGSQEPGASTLNEILYASHPDPGKRAARIEEYCRSLQ